MASDPLTLLLRPPSDETPQMRAMREEKERAAKSISDAIDEAIRQEKIRTDKKKRAVKLLLLGQSESGKSTTLRQFQRLYTPTAFREERSLWRSVIQLNLARSIRLILDALSSASASAQAQAQRSRRRRMTIEESSFPPEEVEGDGYGYGYGYASGVEEENIAGSSGSAMVLREREGDVESSYRRARRPSYVARSNIAHSSTKDYMPEEDYLDTDPYPSQYVDPDVDTDSETIPISPELERLKARLAPLRHVERMLMMKLAPPNEDEATRLPLAGGGGQHVYPPSPSSGSSALSGTGSGSGSGSVTGTGTGVGTSITAPTTHARSSKHHPQNTSSTQPPPTKSSRARSRMRMGAPHDTELFIRSGYSWKGHMAKVQGKQLHSSSRPNTADASLGMPNVDEVTQILHSCRADMIALWRDASVKEVLRKRKVRLEECPGFYLDQIERITSLRYTPTDDDVLRARLKTVGVSEYNFEMESAAGKESGMEWNIFDVGGARSQRASWVPFFEDIDAIIFLAPISGFDQTLVEDRSVNRLEDSVLLWKSICSNKLLSKVDLVLFLNKCDILSQKLRSGVRLAKYVRSYGDRPNEWEAAAQYFRSKFAAIQREYSPQPRKFYGYCTSVTDTTTTSGILASVRDMIVREHLKHSRLI